MIMTLTKFNMRQANWFDRKFNFSTNDNIMPSIIERLAGTHLRVTDKIKNIEITKLTYQPDGKWSILEHIGHLSDLEPLWQGRLEDILNNEKELRNTDLDNKKTTRAGHNNKEPKDLVTTFADIRTETINRLKSLTEADIFRSALHPRLKTPMRILDLFIFVADHDDHHLAKMTEILTY